MELFKRRRSRSDEPFGVAAHGQRVPRVGMQRLAPIRRYALSCGLLLIPASLWNIALTGQLPAPFSPAEFSRGIPAALAAAENGLRVAVFAIPFLMPLDLALPGTAQALVVYAVGTLVYFASWLALMLFPASTWSLFWGTFYRWWMYFVLAMVFVAMHVSHTAMVHARLH